MKFRMLSLGMVLIAGSTLTGCLPSEPSDTSTSQEAPAQTEVTPEQLVDTLIAMSKEPDQYSDTVGRHILTEGLASTGPQALVPLVEYMGAPDTDDDARLFILQCIHKEMGPQYLPAVKNLLASENVVTRASAVMCLGNIEDEESRALLREALDDPSEQVRFSAMSGLAVQGEEELRAELKRMYIENETVGEIGVEDTKREIVRVLLQDPREEDLPILEEALEQEYTAINNRALIAQTLGRMGETRHIAMLEKSLDLQPEEGYGEIVEDAIAAIKEREGTA